MEIYNPAEKPTMVLVPKLAITRIASTGESDKGTGTTSLPRRRRPLILSHANYVLLSEHPSRLMTDISIITTNVRLGWPSESLPGPLPAKRGSFMANRHDIRALQKAVMCLISLLPPSRQLSSREQSQAEPGRNR